MGRKVVVGLGMMILGGFVAVLVALWLPALPAWFAAPRPPFYAVVMLDGGLALVAQLEDGPTWVRLDSTHAEVDPLACRCPVLPPDGDLAQLQTYSRLEFLEVQEMSAGQYRLKASRDDLGGPKVRYRYRCGEAGLQPLLASEEFLGLPVPQLPWTYLASFVVVWTAMAWLLWRRALQG
jgi:hypothetical protein